MDTTSDIKKEIEFLKNEKEENSITPSRVGNILLDILKHVDSKEITASNVNYKNTDVKYALDDLYFKMNQINKALSWKEVPSRGKSMN